MNRTLLVAALVLGSGVSCIAEQPSAAALGFIDDARRACASLNRGQFSTVGAPISEMDLTGDGIPEEIVHEANFRCSTAASLYCGTGGCMVRIIAPGHVFERLAHGWRMFTWGSSRFVLFALHGSECDAPGHQPCYEAVIWSGDRFRSVRPPGNGL